VNPAHLFVGSHKDNSDDKFRKGRQRFTAPKNPARGDRSGARIHPEKIPRGEKAYWAKLTEDQVREIRAQPYTPGLFKRLAEVYPVSDVMISKVYRRKKWTHI